MRGRNRRLRLWATRSRGSGGRTGADASGAFPQGDVRLAFQRPARPVLRQGCGKPTLRLGRKLGLECGAGPDRNRRTCRGNPDAAGGAQAQPAAGTPKGFHKKLGSSASASHAPRCLSSRSLPRALRAASGRSRARISSGALMAVQLTEAQKREFEGYVVELRRLEPVRSANAPTLPYAATLVVFPK